MKGGHITWALSSHPDVIDLIREIAKAENMKIACRSLAAFYGSLGGQLMSVKFYDRDDDSRFVRPYFAYSESVAKLSRNLMKSGGCPLSREAKRTMEPFDIHSMDKSRYSSFADRRFFDEFSKSGHKRIAVLPTMIGKGIALVTVGFFEQPFSGPLRDTVCNSTSHIVAAFITRFPEISTLFEDKILAARESEVLGMMCRGCSMSEISRQLALSESTINLYLDSARRRLGAENTVQLIYKAMLSGEIGRSGHWNC